MSFEHTYIKDGPYMTTTPLISPPHSDPYPTNLQPHPNHRSQPYQCRSCPTNHLRRASLLDHRSRRRSTRHCRGGRLQRSRHRGLQRWLHNDERSGHAARGKGWDDISRCCVGDGRRNAADDGGSDEGGCEGGGCGEGDGCCGGGSSGRGRGGGFSRGGGGDAGAAGGCLGLAVGDFGDGCYGCGRCDGGGYWGRRGVGNPELGRVLVGARCVVDELDAVVRYVCLEGGGGRPGEGAAVGGLFDDGEEREDVFRGPAQEDEGYGTGCCGLGGVLVVRAREGGRGQRRDTYVPGYGVWFANGDDLIEAGFEYGIAGGVCTHGRGIGVCEARESQHSGRK